MLMKSSGWEDHNNNCTVLSTVCYTFLLTLTFKFSGQTFQVFTLTSQVTNSMASIIRCSKLRLGVMALPTPTIEERGDPQRNLQRCGL